METIGIIITILLGLPPIIIFFREKRTKIHFFYDRSISFQEDLLKNFEELKITYLGSPVSEKLTMVSGTLVCDGSKDIIEQNNCIELSSRNSKWLSFKVISFSRGVQAEGSFDNDIAKIKFNTLKKREFIEFQGLIDNGSSGDLDVKLFHRIPNIDPIKKISIKYPFVDYFFVVAIFLFLIFGIWSYYQFSPNKSFSVIPIDNTTGKEFDTEKKLENLNIYPLLLYKLNKDYNRYELLFKDSKVYEIDSLTIGKKKYKNLGVKVHFKSKRNFSSILALLIPIYCVVVIVFYSIKLYYRVSYRKLLKKSKSSDF